jgi:hypothetical protein
MATVMANIDKLTATEIKQTSSMPTVEQTVKDVLKPHLARELYEAELKLAAGLKFAGKPCDFLNNGRNLNLETTTQKLTSLDPNNRVYHEIVDWIQRNRHILSIESVRTGQYDQEYPLMARQLTDFRKRIMGTASLAAMSKPTQPTVAVYSEVAIC